MLVMGGVKLLEDSNASASTSKIYVLDNSSDKWSITGQMPFERRALAVVGLPNNKIIVTGGLNHKERVTDGVWIGLLQPQ